MTFDYRQAGKCLVRWMVMGVPQGCTDLPGTSDTACGSLFEIDGDSAPLAAAGWERFHSLAAKFGYLGEE
jgi:hypothetical protein